MLKNCFTYLIFPPRAGGAERDRTADLCSAIAENGVVFRSFA